MNIYRGSNMSAHVLLNLLNGFEKSDKMRGLSSIFSPFPNSFNKFNSTVFYLSYDVILILL